VWYLVVAWTFVTQEVSSRPPIHQSNSFHRRRSYISACVIAVLVRVSYRRTWVLRTYVVCGFNESNYNGNRVTSGLFSRGVIVSGLYAERVIYTRGWHRILKNSKAFSSFYRSVVAEIHRLFFFKKRYPPMVSSYSKS
jgi:hypothetical protein